MAARFEYRQAQEIAAVFRRHGVRYLFIGKSGAILLGYPDTTQDADLFVEKTPENGLALVAALAELGFDLKPEHRQEIVQGKDFVQLRSGPFDVDLVFAPDGIESFAAAEARSLVVEGLPVCHLDDISLPTTSIVKASGHQFRPDINIILSVGRHCRIPRGSA